MPSALINPDLSRKFQKVNEVLQTSERVLIVSHENPDTDAVASVLALHNILKKEKLESLPYLPGFVPKGFNFLPAVNDIKANLQDSSEGNFDAVLCLDYGHFGRLRLPAQFSNEEKIITIDHHLAGGQRGFIQIVEPQFSSTAEIIYYWLKDRGTEIDKNVAACLLAGMVADSGGFCHASTSHTTFNAVSDLLLEGASLGKITRQTLLSFKSPRRPGLLGQVLARTGLDHNTGLAYSWITFDDLQEAGAGFADFAGIANLISTASGANLGLFLIEYEKGKVRGSLRSEPNRGMGVLGVAEALGGGGHKYAAGFNQEGTPDEVLKKVLNLLK